MQLDQDQYDELRGLAGRVFRQRAGPSTLQPTALVNELWLRLERHPQEFQSHAHFLAAAAQAMRQILANHARAARADKRGGGLRRTTLSGLGGLDGTVDLLTLEALLQELEALAPRCVQVVVLRVFSGLTLDEISQVLELSERTVRREWRFGRAWLAERLTP